ncbi:translesion error-prone DNA polymerase V autoproteolytic subunit [Hymenobacter busanensis]|uniref:Translesion error-prone DNA polymerase V autoproteolytic subunit n=1 Tax=Hymenobacter busanensis TaxID=2607656 RepID=A0A7L4ZXY9_9BACT|nr:translesion error-prone DNA polymerase V autoproteolytic subunit [Hymenobacter busanensis]KAA9339146.1 translesion error-prone DNA polymerase V autoproteolytic subunit [Hymenobacter busanensis]QHJ07092.1 translesion error-prone DNA polymerase V autoproteolytic subunit [Hymenobacter busanensis]
MTSITPFSVAVDWAGFTLPLFACPVPAGFPSPADDFPDAPLNLYELLFAHPASTFLARVSGDSMVGVGIRSGDIVAVDRSLQAGEGSIVVALIEDEQTLKCLRYRNGRPWLDAANERYAPIAVAEGGLHLWGVVTHVIHSFQGAKPKTSPAVRKPVARRP